MSSLRLPSLAGRAQNATVLRWVVASGEDFEKGAPLAELETSREQIVLEAPEAGRLTSILAPSGKTCVPGDVLAAFELRGEAVTDSSSTTSTTSRAVSEPTSPPPPPEGVVVPILMPQAGNTMEEGTVLEWRVAVGDVVTEGQILCEIETDKATMEYESPAAGRVAKLVVPINEPLAVKEIIALFSEDDAAAEAYLTSQTGGGASAAPTGASLDSTNGTQTAVRSKPAPVVVGDGGRVKASPAARKLADERGVALQAVGAGSGPGGRILSSDVATAPAGGATVAAPLADAVRKPLSKMRRAIGLNLQKSKQTVPHFYVRLTIVADPLFAYYREQKTQAGCTLNDIVVLAVGRAMAEFPAVRSQLAENEIVEFAHANIGIAVGVDDGLIVPVVMKVDTRSLAELAVETKRVVENGRRGQLENLGKGNFTISNLGMFGVEEFSAIINPPESGILAVSAVRETVIVEAGEMRAGRVMTMTLSADHRVVDGLLAAKFLARLKTMLENPAGELS